MTDALPATGQELQLIRQRLRLRLRGAGVPEMDVDDVIDQAIEKAAKERLRDDAPAFEIRVRVALRDALIDYRRRKDARVEIDYGVDVPEVGVEPTAFDRVAFRELRDMFLEALGPEALRFALYSIAGHSEAEIARVTAWGPTKTAAVRRRLGERAVKRLKELAKRRDKEAA